MLTLDGTASATTQASAAGVHLLVDLDFSTGIERYTTYSKPISFGGNTYTGLGDLVGVDDLKESEDQGAERIELTFALVNQAMLAALIGPATVYRKRRVNIYVQFIDDTFKASGAAKLRFSGYMDAPGTEIDDEPTQLTEDVQVFGRIILPCWRAGHARMRNASGLRRTHAQQLQRTGGIDTGLRYTQTLVEKPTPWLSIAFQKV